jgi:carboxyl-terminal processing protease
MKINHFKTISVALLLSMAFFACKKDNKATVLPTPVSSTGTRDELTKDSLFLYAKDVYLWNDALPTYDVFKPRNYNTSGTHLTNFESELFAISQFKINPTTGKPYEYIDGSNGQQALRPKYSFIEDLVASGKLTIVPNQLTSVGLDGQGNDFGVALSATGTNDNYQIYLRFASPGSPSALAGLGRGDIINKINGTSIGTNFNSEVNFINDALDAATKTSVQLGGIKKDGSTYNVTLTKVKYTSSPIYKDSIYTVGSKKIGYFAYARFSNTDNSFVALDNIFSKFVTAGVTDLVVDLRYNGGGYVNTAQHLINLIVPTSQNGKVMFAQAYNSTMQSGAPAILRNQPVRDQSGKIVFSNGKIVTYADYSYTIAANTEKIEKTSGLTNVGKVVFITTGGTASASELVINSLKPYVDVKTVGKTSYGKPVGFSPIRIDKYDVYMSMFSSTNASGDGNYFAGFTPNSEKTDDVTRDFGNISETCLAAALGYINTGVFPSSTASNQTMSIKGVTTSSAVVNVRDVFSPPSFKGMIDYPHIRIK